MGKKDTHPEKGNSRPGKETRSDYPEPVPSVQSFPSDYASSKDVAELASALDFLRKEVMSLSEIVHQHNQENKNLLNGIVVNVPTLADILKVSKRSILRWSDCFKDRLPKLNKHKDENGNLKFYLMDIYQAIQCGQFVWKGMCATVVLKSIEDYMYRNVGVVPIRCQSGLGMNEDSRYY